MEAIRKEIASRLHEAVQGLEVLAYSEFHAYFVHLRGSNVEPDIRTARKGSWTAFDLQRLRKESSSLDEAEKAECRAILECLAQIGDAVGPVKTL